VELAEDWHAGEDYRGWSQDDAWRPYQEHLARARASVTAAETSGAEPRLTALAWKHLLASAYETAWHDTDRPDRPPAAWAKAVASHARAATVLAAAARWFGRADRPLGAERVDVDDDGDVELVLRNEHLFAVFAPDHGGRLVYLAVAGPDGGALVVGNPTDDWNCQEAMNRYMDVPANHPGALADLGSVHDRFEVTVHPGEGVLAVELEDVQQDSPLCGLRKRILLEAGSAALLVGYDLPLDVPSLTVETFLSPDYHQLLRAGADALHPLEGRTWRGARTDRVSVWVALAADEDTSWCARPEAEPGHGLLVRLRADTRRFHLALGAGAVDDGTAASAVLAGRERLARMTGAAAAGAPR
jgi:hypothetical protein